MIVDVAYFHGEHSVAVLHVFLVLSLVESELVLFVAFTMALTLLELPVVLVEAILHPVATVTSTY